MKKILTISSTVLVALLLALITFANWAVPAALGPPGPCDVPLGEEKLGEYLLDAINHDMKLPRKRNPGRYPEVVAAELLSYDLQWSREDYVFENFTYKAMALNDRVATGTGLISCHEINTRMTTLEFD